MIRKIEIIKLIQKTINIGVDNMKKLKLRYSIIILGIIILFIILSFNDDNNLDLELDGYAFSQENIGGLSHSEIYSVNIKVDAYINDNDLSNDKIQIKYEDIIISENIVLKGKTNERLRGNIIDYNNVSGNDEILGEVILLNKGEECFISLYNEDLNIIAPVNDIEKAKEKLKDY